MNYRSKEGKNNYSSRLIRLDQIRWNLKILAVIGLVSKGEKVGERALVVEQIEIRARIHHFRLVLQRLIRRVK